MKNTLFTLLTTLTISVCCSASAHAIVIYDEAVSGDLVIPLPDSPEFLLGEGTSTLLGSVLVGDIDDFRVRPLGGLEITGGIFTFQGQGTLFYNSNAVPVVGGGIFQGFLGGDGTVLIDSFPQALFRLEGQAGSFDWRFDFTVRDPNAAVPEGGSTLAMLGLVSVGVFGLRRKCA